MSFCTTSTAALQARSWRTSVFPLLLDDEEDSLDLCEVLQHIIQGPLDDLLLGLDSAPAVGPGLLDRSVDLERQIPILLEVVVEGAASRRIDLFGRVLGLPCLHALRQLGDAFQVFLVLEIGRASCRERV